MGMIHIFVIKPMIVMIMIQMFIQVLPRFAMVRTMTAIFQHQANTILGRLQVLNSFSTKTGMDIIRNGHAANQMMIVMIKTAQYMAHIQKFVATT